MTDAAELRSRRLSAQGLRPSAESDGPAPESPVDVSAVVGRALAVQSQEYLPAQWGLAQRFPPAARPTADEVAALIDDGRILRTHVLRPTWHFVLPRDIRWLLELSAERVGRIQATYERRLGIEGEPLTRALDAMARAVEGGRHRTRAELADALATVGWDASGGAMLFLLLRAELERVLISGASAGKQRTYAAFDERVPPSAPKPREEALAELAERYLLTRGPATARDLSTWSGFGLRDARTALVEASDRTGGRIERFGGDPAEELWHDASVSVAWSARDAARAEADDDPARVDLLQAYDEYVMGYTAPRTYLLPEGRSDSTAPQFPLHAVAVGGVLAGRWAPVVQAKRADLRFAPWRRMSRAERASLDTRVAELEAFLGVPVAVVEEPVVE